MNIQAIDLTGLIWAAGFVALIAALSWLLRLGLVRTLLIAATRTYVQLMLLGYALVFIFAWDHPLATGVIFGLMMLFSTHTILSRLKEVEASIFIPIFFAVFAGGFAITLAVTAVIIRIEPFWQARYWLPLGGMVLGNSMNGIAISVERLWADMQHREHQIRTMFALGASPSEAGRSSIRTALRAGLIPTINNMAAVGVVSIPGMMTGQVLAGADPIQAARYQIVVMLMIAASTALGAMMATLGVSRVLFRSEKEL